MPACERVLEGASAELRGDQEFMVEAVKHNVCMLQYASVELQGDRLAMEVDYTTSRPVPGLSGLRPLPGGAGKWIAEQIWNLRVPVGAVWKLLPWNKGLAPTCAVKLVYHDGDMRIVEEDGGSLFVYMRPVAPRPIDGPQFK